MIMGQEKGQNQWKSRKFRNFDDMMHINRAGLYLAQLVSMSRVSAPNINRM